MDFWSELKEILLSSPTIRPSWVAPKAGTRARRAGREATAQGDPSLVRLAGARRGRAGKLGRSVRGIRHVAMPEARAGPSCVSAPRIKSPSM
jgi:hypothetical protein